MVEGTSDERWLPVAGYEGVYEVSSLGRIRSLDRRIQDRNRKIKGRVLGAGMRDSGGYIQHTLCRGDGSQTVVWRHIVVATTFHGPRPDGCVVRHLDGNKLNNAAINLRWGTPSENQQDKIRHGRNHNLNKSACPLGHLLEPFNLVRSSLPARKCWACMLARNTCFKYPERDFTAEAHYRYGCLLATRQSAA